MASECTEYLDVTQSSRTAEPDKGQTITAVPPTHNETSQHQTQGSGVDATTLSTPDTRTKCSLEPGVGGGTPVIDTSVLQSFQEQFLHFSPERFQEVKAQASALRGSRGMRVWNAAWLRCKEAQQQLQERLQESHEVLQRPLESDSCCERHYVDVLSTDVQVASPGGQSLHVQSTPGPRHPQWESIVSGEVDLGKRRPLLRNDSVASAADEPENPNTDAGMGSKVTTQSQSPRR